MRSVRTRVLEYIGHIKMHNTILSTIRMLMRKAQGRKEKDDSNVEDGCAT